ncbi:hypothetical protein PSHT_14422 [Puccinia striiformis]|uniref:Uncharacterized protein n=1 Tax=Puccinia striiformis TaxID=27350 RepID=A0A2S4UK14_9BASI|nr:hypothetical protein PSHT_14422 [Puccinia striiformis]
MTMPSANLPVEGISSEEYANDMPHEPLLDLMSYFNKSAEVVRLTSSDGTSQDPVRLSKGDEMLDPFWGTVTNNITLLTQFKGLRLVQTSFKKCGFKVRFLTYPWVSSLKRFQNHTHPDESRHKSYYIEVEEYETCELKDVILLILIPFPVGDNQSLKLYDQDQSPLGCLVGHPITLNLKFMTSTIGPDSCDSDRLN